jgi:hypothetical protein
MSSSEPQGQGALAGEVLWLCGLQATHTTLRLIYSGQALANQCVYGAPLGWFLR